MLKVDSLDNDLRVAQDDFSRFFVKTAACGFQKVENISTHYRIIENIE